MESEESDCEDENDFLTSSVVSTLSTSFNDNSGINKIKLMEDNRNEYLKLLYINENKAVKILKNIASESWWSTINSGILVQGGNCSSHFALKWYLTIFLKTKLRIDVLNYFFLILVILLARHLK